MSRAAVKDLGEIDMTLIYAPFPYKREDVILPETSADETPRCYLLGPSGRMGPKSCR